MIYLRQLPAIVGIIILAASLATSCKTTEKNYRTAYQRTIAADNDSDRTQFDQTIYGRYRRDMRMTPVIIGNDTLDVRAQRITLTTECGGINENIKEYLVVAGEFKQLFNARSMCERLRLNGYPGAFVVQNAEPYYFVITQGYHTAAQAHDAIDKIKSQPPFRLRQGMPWILNPLMSRRR